MKRVLILVLLAITTLFVSCNKESNPVKPNADTYVQAKVGSSFTYDEYSIDPGSGLPISESRDSTMQTILTTGMNFMGKTNVTKVVSNNRSGSDTIYINIEKNNDLSIFQVIDAELGDPKTVWFSLPTGTKSVISTVLLDTIVKFFDEETQVKLSIKTSYINEEQLLINGQSLKVYKISHLTTQLFKTGAESMTFSSESFIYFAPSLGFIVKAETPVSQNEFGEYLEGFMSTLIDYTIK